MLGVCYYPEHWPEAWWPEDARRMRDTGISFVRIGEFAWSKLEPKRGVFEWGWLDRAIDVLGKAGLKVVLGTLMRRMLGCHPPRPSLLPTAHFRSSNRIQWPKPLDKVGS